MLTDENFIVYAMRTYDNPHCKTLDDFNEDLNKITHIKKLLNRVIANEPVNYRLILNHLVTFFNVFEYRSAVALLFFKIDTDKWGLLKTFLSYLNYAPDYIPELQINLTKIDTIRYIEEELEKI